MNAYVDGYMAGVRDARTGRTPEHSQTHYAFPRHGSDDQKRIYNAEYYKAVADMANAKAANQAYRAKVGDEVYFGF